MFRAIRTSGAEWMDEAKYWNQFPGLRKVIAVTPQRKKSLEARRADPFFQTSWREAIKKVAASDFCKGKNDRGWIADFDFFLRPGTLVKIMEGKYDNRVKPVRNNLEGTAP